jgi:diguanylate cyclase (GGDEF)-like protein
MIVSTALLILTLFEPIVFRVDAANTYTRGPLLWVNLTVTYIMHGYVLAMAFRNRHRIRGRLVTVILLFTLLPAVGALFQMLYYGLLTIWPVMAMVLVLTYVFVESYNASLDYLTGLFNRLRADEYIHGLMDAESRFGIVVIDLDDFKTINDTYGHHEGDAALIAFAEALSAVFAGQRMIARFGGDEFIVVTSTTEAAAFDGMEERLGRRIQELNEEAGTRFTLSFSLGYAIFDPDKPVSYDELFIEADQRMYAEKRANKRLRRRADDPGFP